MNPSVYILSLDNGGDGIYAKIIILKGRRTKAQIHQIINKALISLKDSDDLQVYDLERELTKRGLTLLDYVEEEISY